MAQIKYIDTDGDKSRILPKGYFGMDEYPAGNDVGRVYISTGAENIALAKKAEVDLKADKSITYTKNEVDIKLDEIINSNQTIAGVKTFSSNPISSAIQSTAANALTRKDYVDELNSTNVKLTGNQTIAGVKTFQNEIINTSSITAGQGSGSVSLTVNDGHGNASVAFNHKDGIPDIAGGSSARITATVDSPTASMQFQLKDNMEMGTPTVLVPVMTLKQNVAEFHKPLIVPTPTAGNQAVNKEYVDSNSLTGDRIGLIDYGYVAKSYHIVAFGGEFNRADYPKLWAYLQANQNLLRNQAEWQSQNTTNGMCGFFSRGNGTTTFRVPNLNKAFLRPDNRGVGTYQADAFKSHTHTQTVYALRVAYGGGGISARREESSTSTGSAGSTETRPKNIAVLPLIVAK